MIYKSRFARTGLPHFKSQDSNGNEITKTIDFEKHTLRTEDKEVIAKVEAHITLEIEKGVKRMLFHEEEFDEIVNPDTSFIEHKTVKYGFTEIHKIIDFALEKGYETDKTKETVYVKPSIVKQGVATTGLANEKLIKEGVK